MCSLHLTHPCSHTPGALRSRHCGALGSSWGIGALLKGLTSVVDTSCQSRDSNLQPWVTSGFRSNALSMAMTALDFDVIFDYKVTILKCSDGWIIMLHKVFLSIRVTLAEINKNYYDCRNMLIQYTHYPAGYNCDNCKWFKCTAKMYTWAYI